MEILRPYAAAFAARFQLMLQYRAAALAGFATQCWWGGIKVMIYAAFYATPGGQAAPISLSQTITYTWLAQGFLTLTPWSCDPDISQAVKTGAIGYDRLRPVDTYGWWYARGAAWLVARAALRAPLMIVAAGVVLPLLGLRDWALGPPASAEAFVLFLVSLVLAAAVSAALIVLLNVVAVITLDERGINGMISALLIAFSGNLLPLSLYPDWMQAFLLLQPFASFLDIPFRLYFGASTGGEALAALGVQAFWIAALVVLGRALLRRTMLRLQMQGG